MARPGPEWPLEIHGPCPLDAEEQQPGICELPNGGCPWGTWGQVRIHDFITIQWMLEHHPRHSENKLWAIMDMFYSTGMHHIPLRAGETTITYTIGTSLRTERRPNNTVAVYYGNVLYALDVGFENMSSIPHFFNDPTGPGLDNPPFPQLRDDVVNHTRAWAVAVDQSTLQYYGKSDSTSLPEPIFEQGAPPTFATVVGCKIRWDLYRDITPDWAPANRTCTGLPRRFKIIPYGAAKVHISDLPVINMKTPCLLAAKARFRHQLVH